MNTLKVTIAFVALAVSIVLCLWAVDVIGGDVAGDTSKKLVLVIGIIGITSTVVYGVLSTRQPSDKTKSEPNSGPKF
jgi:arginine exporter protein ArgO